MAYRLDTLDKKPGTVEQHDVVYHSEAAIVHKSNHCSADPNKPPPRPPPKPYSTNAYDVDVAKFNNLLSFSPKLRIQTLSGSMATNVFECWLQLALEAIVDVLITGIEGEREQVSVCTLSGVPWYNDCSRKFTRVDGGDEPETRPLSRFLRIVLPCPSVD
jgi:hypothetical protein